MRSRMELNKKFPEKRVVITEAGSEKAHEFVLQRHVLIFS